MKLVCLQMSKKYMQLELLLRIIDYLSRFLPVSTPGTPCPPAVAAGVGCVVDKVTEGTAARRWEDGIVTNIARRAVGELALSSTAGNLSGSRAAKEGRYVVWF